jgi:hypothetical protein
MSHTAEELPGDTAPGRLPDFLIVGHAKSGTTALYEMLRRHPQIFMPDDKEPWFFASDMRPRFQPRAGGLPPANLAEYMRLFAAAAPGQMAGEASSSYLWSHTAAAAIAEVKPDARLIAILREPADFLRSLHLQLLQSHVESVQDFRRAIELEPDRRAGKRIPRRSHRPQLLRYSEHVHYVEQLERYRAAFPAEQMLVLIYDDFRADNEATVRTVLRFLGAEDSLPVEVLRSNPSVRVRSQQLDDLVHSVSVGRDPLSRAAKTAVKALAPGSASRRLLQSVQRNVVLGEPRPVDQEFMRQLRVRFKDEVVAVSEYLGRDLVRLWGYEDIG